MPFDAGLALTCVATWLPRPKANRRLALGFRPVGGLRPATEGYEIRDLGNRISGAFAQYDDPGSFVLRVLNSAVRPDRSFPDQVGIPWHVEGERDDHAEDDGRILQDDRENIQPGRHGRRISSSGVVRPSSPPGGDKVERPTGRTAPSGEAGSPRGARRGDPLRHPEGRGPAACSRTFAQIAGKFPAGKRGRAPFLASPRIDDGQSEPVSPGAAAGV